MLRQGTSLAIFKKANRFFRLEKNPKSTPPKVHLANKHLRVKNIFPGIKLQNAELGSQHPKKISKKRLEGFFGDLIEKYRAPLFKELVLLMEEILHHLGCF